MKRTKLSDQIAERLQTMIADGSLQPGAKLPPERELAEQLKVSRPSLREAIQKLSYMGLLTSRQGGGTFVNDEFGPSFVDPLISLFNAQPEARFDVLEVRHALESTAAYYAALRHTNADKETIQRNFDQMIAMHGHPDPMEEAKADAAFHLSIAEAAHNPVLLHIMHSLFSLLQNSVSHNLDKIYTLPNVFEPLSQQHERMAKKVMERDAEGARRAAQEHMVFVEESLQQVDRAEARKLRDLRHLAEFE